MSWAISRRSRPVTCAVATRQKKSGKVGKSQEKVGKSQEKVRKNKSGKVGIPTLSVTISLLQIGRKVGIPTVFPRNTTHWIGTVAEIF